MFGRALAAGTLLLASAPANAQDGPVSPAPMTPAGWAETCDEWDEWDRPAPPFRIFANTYYVGTCGISVILITGQTGHFLIADRTEEGGPMIATNIQQLGFDPEDVRFFLLSRETFDHADGLTYLQELSGGLIRAGRAGTPPVSSGAPRDTDPQAGVLPASPPIQIETAIRSLEDGNRIQLGFLQVTAMATPGHTPGAMTYTWRSCEGDHPTKGENCRQIVYTGGLAPVSTDGYRFSEPPETVASLRDSLSKIAALDCDILLTAYPSASGMRDKLIANDLTAEPICADYAASAVARLDARLAEEAAAAQ